MNFINTLLKGCLVFLVLLLSTGLILIALENKNEFLIVILISIAIIPICYLLGKIVEKLNIF
jgi:hypothetical protein